MTPEAVRAAAIELMDEYVERIDDDRLEEWLDLFAEDCSYRIAPRENVDQNLPASIIHCPNKNALRDRIVSLRNANAYNLHYDRHLVSNVRVAPAAGGLWQLKANYAAYQTTHGGESRLFSVGRYRDKLRFEGERLLFTEKLVIVDTFSVPTLLATPL